MNDESKIPFGKYKGDMLINVPANYLLWLYENDKCYGELREYITENKDALLKEMG